MLTAEKLMRQPLLTIAAGESVASAIRAMQVNGVSSLIIPPNYDGEEYGILTKHDVVSKVVAENRDPRRVRVAEVMTRPLVAVEPDCPARRCATLMMRHRIRRLPVLVKGQPVGMVSDSDVFDALLNIHTEAALSASL
jgi:signal-transduction protein with cAMP-binding, CBS, and nucleotidyltransferase domain